MNEDRPVNLNLFNFHFPVMAIVSIIHRITGVIIFLFIPVLLYVLHVSLVSSSWFSNLQQSLNHPIEKILLIAVLVCAIYHLFAGIRHLVMDLGIGDSLTTGRVTAWVVILLSLVAAILLGVWLW